EDKAYGIAVDAVGNSYVTGETLSSNFPTQDGYDPSANGGTDVFVSKLNARGNDVVYSTYLGGSGDDKGYAIAVDPAGSAYVTGVTPSGFPTTDGAYKTTEPAAGVNHGFLTKLSASGDALVYSSYVGGGSTGIYQEGRGVAVSPDGVAYVTG